MSPREFIFVDDALEEPADGTDEHSGSGASHGSGKGRDDPLRQPANGFGQVTRRLASIRIGLDQLEEHVHVFRIALGGFETVLTDRQITVAEEVTVAESTEDE
ncbi:hypothetical protein [Gemmatimonas sp.]